MNIKKVVFPVAGLGSRFLPATKAIPKEMLPINDKPLIQYAVEEAIDAGFTELIFITGETKRAITEHFNFNPDLSISNLTKDKKNYLSEMDAVIFQYPFIYDYYEMITKNLIAIKKFDEALPYFYKYDKIRENAYTSKWIGIIELSKGNESGAIKYLTKSLKYNSQDAQVYYNLAGAYSLQNKLKPALDAINSCIMVNPNYKGAKSLQKQLLEAAKR